MLQVKNIEFSYPDRKILNNISFNLKKGEIISILGENGSGKSSLLKLIAGLTEPDAGEIIFNNEKVKGPSFYLVPGHKEIKMVFQDFALAKKQTVFENIKALLPPIIEKEKDDRTFYLLKLLRLTHLSMKKVEELSGGEKQKLSFARALANQPKLLLMDEPFSNLDAFIKEDIRNNIFDVLKTLSVSAIFITHDPAEAFRFSDKILVLRHGKIIRVGSPESIYSNPGNVYSAKLTGPVNIISKDLATRLKVKTENRGRFLRPEQLQLNLNQDNPEGIPGIVAKSSFMGINYLLVIDLGMEKIQIYNSESLPIGKNVQIMLKPANKEIFKELNY